MNHSVIGDCILGRTDLVETSAYPNPSLFDTDNPAVCSGQITAWNVCYYDNPRSFTQLNTLQISLQIWRFDEPIRNGVRVDEHVETVTIPETPENFQCIELSPDEYMNISAGDFVGVLLVTDAVLPVIGNTLNDSTASLLYSVFNWTELDTTQIAMVLGKVLHITADIGKEKIRSVFIVTVLAYRHVGVNSTRQEEKIFKMNQMV